MSDVLEDVKGFITTQLLDGDARGLEANTNLLEQGLINSQAIVKLTAFFMDRYQLRVPFKELRPDNLKTPQAIAELVKRLRG